MTDLAQEWQKILDTEPNVDHCDNKAGLEVWKKHGPFKLSWLALNSTVPVDLDDEKFKIDSGVSEKGNHVTRVIGKDKKIPDDYLHRCVTKSGQIQEGFHDFKAEHFIVICYTENKLLQGYWTNTPGGKSLNGHGQIIRYDDRSQD